MPVMRLFLCAVALALIPVFSLAASSGYIMLEGVAGEVPYRPSPDGRIDILTHHWGKSSPGTKVRTAVPVEPLPGAGNLTVSLSDTASTKALEHYCSYKRLPALSLFLPKAGGLGRYTEYRLEDVKVTCMPSVQMGGRGPDMGAPGAGWQNKGGMAVQEFQFSYVRLKKQ